MPPRRPKCVARPRLIQKLNADGHQRLTLVSAPPGFGKTTLLVEWLAEKNEPFRPCDVAWIALDQTDNDPAQFLRYLIASLQQVAGHIGTTVQQFLGTAQSPPVQVLLTMLVGEISTTGTAVRLVLDDYHTITNPAVHQITQFLAEHLPACAHLVIATREDPPLPLPRLRARGQIVEVRERDLRFTPAEAATFLSETMALPLSRSSIAALATRSEGWIAALQLAALLLQEGTEDGSADVLAAEFAGSDRYVMDYLMSEVLDRQPQPVRDFLISTAILDRFTAGLCDAVTQRNDSHIVLEHLAHKNLFLISLDHHREWYRYYRLFAEFLRTRLDSTTLGALHQAAAGWYEHQGLINEAIQHALAAAPISGAWEHAVRLIRATADEQIQNGAVSTLRAWLDQLPQALVCADGELATFRAWTSVMCDDFAQAERDAAVAAPIAEGDIKAASPSVQGKRLILQAMLAMGRQDHEQVITLAERALAAFGDTEPHWRTLALWELAEAQERTRPIEQAIASLRQIQSARPGQRTQFFVPAIDAFLAAALNNHGQRRAAIAVCERRLSQQRDVAGHCTIASGMVLTQLTLLHWEGNELALASEYAGRAVALAEQCGFPDLLIFALGSAAIVAHAQCDDERVLDLLRRSEALVTTEMFSDTSWLRAWHAGIDLQRGNDMAVARWAESERLSPDSEPTYLHMDSLLVYARFLLAQAHLPEARRLLAHLEDFVMERGLRRYQITVHLLQALLAQQSGEHSAARDRIMCSLKLAVLEGYLRHYLDEGYPILSCLTPIRYVAPEFIDQITNRLTDRLVSQRENKPADAPHSPQTCLLEPLLEPLTEREHEILRLLNAGLPNAEIARQLFIATGTVKRHLNNIYSKLGVESRTQAIARARELGML
ncbi:MAG: LuxR C-terminal-related transcriptional regulator [Chloroflexi bacterium]|nr:LuxR C-terminal-related transcriptional regulator [Chloroflexota bacterium]